MKSKIIFLYITLFSWALVSAQENDNKLTFEEQNNGWILLFDGETSTGWTSWKEGKSFPESGWLIKDGMITLENTVNPRPGCIITEEEFTDFELSVDFKISEGANSGIKYYILPGSTLGLEFQILDDDNHPDAKEGTNGNRLQGSLYDMKAPNTKASNPIGEWNHARIIAKDNKIQHWLNGVKVVEITRFSTEWNDKLNESKYKSNKTWGTPLSSPILLQDHGDIISFKNIKIKRL